MIDEKSSGQAKASGIHPAPEEFKAHEIALDPVLHFFHYAHLPPKLQETSKAFFTLAQFIIRTVPRSPERTVALRKLLEGKDAAVRANLELPRVSPHSGVVASENLEPGEPVEIGGHDEMIEPLKFGD